MTMRSINQVDEAEQFFSLSISLFRSPGKYHCWQFWPIKNRLSFFIFFFPRYGNVRAQLTRLMRQNVQTNKLIIDSMNRWSNFGTDYCYSMWKCIGRVSDVFNGGLLLNAQAHSFTLYAIRYICIGHWNVAWFWNVKFGCEHTMRSHAGSSAIVFPRNYSLQFAVAFSHSKATLLTQRH